MSDLLVFVCGLLLWLAYFAYGTLIAPSQVPTPPVVAFVDDLVLLHPPIPPPLAIGRSLHPHPLLCLLPPPPNINIPQKVPLPHKQIAPPIQPQTRPQPRLPPTPKPPRPPLDIPSQNRPRRRRRQGRTESTRRDRGRVYRRMGDVQRRFLGGGRETDP